MADFGWQNWSQFGKVDAGIVSSNSPAKTINLNYQDTWHGAVGAQFHSSEKWLFSGGVAFDSSAVDNANRTVTLPMGQAWRFGLGAQYQISKAVNLGAAYEFMWAGTMSVDQGTDTSLRGRVSGGYDDAWFSFLTLNLTWKF
jgi:long-chain fatty acid transport protein